MFYRHTDTEAPNIECPSNLSKSTEDEKSTALVLWKQPNATDNSGYVKEVTCSTQAGSLFPIGQTKVTCEAVDDAGNNASCHFFVDIVGM